MVSAMGKAMPRITISLQYNAAKMIPSVSLRLIFGCPLNFAFYYKCVSFHKLDTDNCKVDLKGVLSLTSCFSTRCLTAFTFNANTILKINYKNAKFIIKAQIEHLAGSYLLGSHKPKSTVKFVKIWI